jgi:double-stranded uracil-DNA glycosylase
VRPTRQELAGAAGRTVPDLVAPGLRVLWCGINPSLYSAAVGAHFARPGNRFWKVLHQSGFTHRLLDPAEQRLLLEAGLGVTNLVARATASASELTAEELREGAARLERRVRRWKPAAVAFLGLLAYRRAWERPNAAIGPQPQKLAGAGVWVLPNPSGLQARYQLPEMVRQWASFREALEVG